MLELQDCDFFLPLKRKDWLLGSWQLGSRSLWQSRISQDGTAGFCTEGTERRCIAEELYNLFGKSCFLVESDFSLEKRDTDSYDNIQHVVLGMDYSQLTVQKTARKTCISSKAKLISSTVLDWILVEMQSWKIREWHEILNIQMDNGQTTYNNRNLTHNLCRNRPRKPNHNFCSSWPKLARTSQWLTAPLILPHPP